MKKLSKKKIINPKFTKTYRNIKEIIEKRYNILIILIVVSFIIIGGNLFFIQVLNNSYYLEQIELLNRNIVTGTTAPRGRIYDRNHKLIVDNKPIKVIFYKKQLGVTIKQEIELSYTIAEMIDVNFQYLSDTNFKKFWLLNNRELGNSKITDKEWQELQERKITNADIETLKLERVTEEELSIYNDFDKKAAYIYYLMNVGYSYTEKVIKKNNVSDLEYARISENVHKLNGFNTRLDWEREYLYNDIFRLILGNVSTSEAGIPYELKDYYLSKGYSLDDRVGISYLEKQYEEYLRGVKNTYQIVDNSYILIEEGQRGNDIVLTIDIELQKAVEEILTDQLIKAKNDRNTEYFDKSFVIISNPHTGEILAMAGKQIIKENSEYKIYDYTPGVVTETVTAGSIVKGASHITAYNQGILKIGEVRDDYCVKIAATPEKCSWRYLGMIDDIAALKQSSNSYQYQSAIKIGGGIYVRNQPLSVNPAAFEIYRNTFAEFGLGVKTGIDLPLESLGYKGNSTLSGHLLDFAIGQYDTYTPIQISQYINTIANSGNRVQPYLLKSVHEPIDGSLGEKIYETEPTILNKVNTKEEFLKRVQLGFKEVLGSGGTGAGHMPVHIKPAGKTGTSEGFIDTDLDGLIDTQTYTNNFIGYAPYDNPIATFTVVSPDVSHNYNNSRYKTGVNRKISFEVSKKFFELYE